MSEHHPSLSEPDWWDTLPPEHLDAIDADRVRRYDNRDLGRKLLRDLGAEVVEFYRLDRAFEWAASYPGTSVAAFVAFWVVVGLAAWAVQQALGL